MELIYKALAHPIRRQLLDALYARNGQTLQELTENLSISRQAVTKHLAILRDGDLVSFVKYGRFRLHYLNRTPIKNISTRWMDKFELDEYLPRLSDGASARPDFTYSIVIKASLKQVWNALTDPKMTKLYWYDAEINSTWRKRSEVWLVREDGTSVGGKLLRFEKFRKLAYEFMRHDQPVRKKPVEVHFELIAIGELTKLIVVSKNLNETDLNDNPHALYGLNNGWPMFMSSMKSLLETGKGFDVE